MQTLDKMTQAKVRRASEKLGLSERELLQRAIGAYLSTIDDVAALARELHAWDELSAATMRKNNF